MIGEPTRWSMVLHRVSMCIVMLLTAAALGTSTRAGAQESASNGQNSQLQEDYQEQGINYFHHGDLQRALESFRSAIDANPKDAISHDYIGVILGESGNLDAALREFREAIRLNHRLSDPHYHLGLAYDRTGRTNDAIAEYHEALWLNPSMLDAKYGLSAICAKLGDLSGAVHLLRDVVKTVPNFAEAHYNLGLNLWNGYKSSSGARQKSDLDEATEEFKTAIRLDSRQPKVYLALGQLLA